MSYKRISPQPVIEGGTGALTFTAYAPVIAGTTATGAFQSASTGLATSGFVLTSNGASAVPSFQAPSGGGMTWIDQTSTPVTMAVGNGYSANLGSLITLTLPSTAAFGSLISVAGYGAGGWLIAQNSGQTIHFGNQNTTTGVGGSLASINRYDGVSLLCTVADTDFVVLSSIGNITVV